MCPGYFQPLQRVVALLGKVQKAYLCVFQTLHSFYIHWNAIAEAEIGAGFRTGMQIHFERNRKCRRRTVVRLTNEWKGGTLSFASPLQRRGGAAVFQTRTLGISAACPWVALSTSACSCFCQTPRPSCPGLVTSFQSYLHVSRELVSSHFNWLRKCLRSQASPILSQLEDLSGSKQFPYEQMLFLVRSLRFRHPSLPLSFNNSIVHGADEQV